MGNAKIVLFCLLTLFTTNLWAQSFYQYWDHSKLFTRSFPDKSQVQMKTMKRYTKGKTRTFMASSNFTFLPKYKGTESIEDIRRSIQIGFGKDKKWKMIKKTNGYEMITYIPNGNRIARIQIAKGKWGFYTFSSLIRPGFYASLLKEIDSLEKSFYQYVITHDNPKKTSFYNKFISNFLIPKAHAQVDGLDFGEFLGGDNEDILGLGGAIDVSGSIDVSGTVDVNTTHTINPGDIDRIENLINGGTLNLNNSVQDVITSNEGIANQLDATIRDTSAETNQTIRDVTDQTNQTIRDVSAETNANVNANVDKIIASNEKIANQVDGTANRALDLAEQSLDKDHMGELAATIGFATAAGAALGSMSVNLMVSSVKGIAAWIHEFITDDKAEAKRLENFNKAMVQWEKFNKQIGALEKTFDRFLKSFEKLDGLSSEDILAELNETTDKLYFKALLAKEVAEDKNVSERCRYAAFRASREYQRLGGDLQKIVKYSQKNGVLNFTDLEGFYCEQLENIRRKLVDAELGLSNLRLALLNGQRQYFQAQEDAIEEAQDQVDFYNSRSYRKKRAKAVKDYVDTIKDIAEDNSEDKEKKWVKKCKKSKSGIGSFLNEQVEKAELGLFQTKRGHKEKLCKKAYKTMQNYYKDQSQLSLNDLLAKAERDADLALEQSKQKDIQLNVNDYARNAVVMKNWFRKLELEAHCKNVMNQSQVRSPEYQRCQEISPQLVNLSRATRLAENNFADKCQNRFEGFAQEAFGEKDPEEEFEMFLRAQEFEKLPKAQQVADDVREGEEVKRNEVFEGASWNGNIKANLQQRIDTLSTPEPFMDQNLNQDEFDGLYTGPDQELYTPWSDNESEWIMAGDIPAYT